MQTRKSNTDKKWRFLKTFLAFLFPAASVSLALFICGVRTKLFVKKLIKITPPTTSSTNEDENIKIITIVDDNITQKINNLGNTLLKKSRELSSSRTLNIVGEITKTKDNIVPMSNELRNNAM